MKINKLHPYLFGLIITLCLCVKEASAAEKGKRYVEIAPISVARIIEDQTCKSGEFSFEWAVTDQTKSTSKTRILKTSLNKAPNNIVSTITYTISGEKLVKSSGDDNATYDPLGHIISFSGNANGGINYIIDLEPEKNELMFVFDGTIFKNAVCQVIYDGDSFQTIYLPSQEKWNHFIDTNLPKSTACKK